VDNVLTARPGVAHLNAGFYRFWVRNLDKAKEEPDFGFLNFDHDGHLAGIIAPVRLRIV